MKLLLIRQDNDPRPLFIRWDAANYALLAHGRRTLQRVTTALAWLSFSKRTAPATVVASVVAYARTLGWKDPT